MHTMVSYSLIYGFPTGAQLAHCLLPTVSILAHYQFACWLPTSSLLAFHLLTY